MPGALVEVKGKATSLERGLQRVEGRRRRRALALVAPLLLFMAVFYLLPIASVLFHAVDDRRVARVLPRTVAALSEWTGERIPEEAVFANLVSDLSTAYKEKTLGSAASRLNDEISGFRSVLMKTARRAHKIEEGPFRARVLETHEAWGNLDYWRAIESATGPFTIRYLLAALDLERDWDGSISGVDETRAVYLDYLGRTFSISLVVTLLCCVIGYPMAYVMASAVPRWRRLLVLLVLLPFWTSLLVRTTAWLILLRSDGAVNDILLSLHLVDAPMQLIFNRFAVYITLLHIMLPFMVLPLYSVMRGVPPDYVRAAASLGARPAIAFLTVYLPQTLPGLGAGCILVFIVTLGFYITPALVGGAKDQMLSYLIAEFVTRMGNWSMAGAVAIVLLAMVAIVFPILLRGFGLNRLRFD